MGVDHSGTTKTPNRLVTMFLRFADWLGSARRENDDISADAVRIASLEFALRQANIKAMVWQVKAEDLQDKLDALCEREFAREAEMQRAAPLVAYALRQKANRARYDAKRRRR